MSILVNSPRYWNHPDWTKISMQFAAYQFYKQWSGLVKWKWHLMQNFRLTYISFWSCLFRLQACYLEDRQTSCKNYLFIYLFLHHDENKYCCDQMNDKSHIYFHPIYHYTNSQYKNHSGPWSYLDVDHCIHRSEVSHIQRIQHPDMLPVIFGYLYCIQDMSLGLVHSCADIWAQKWVITYFFQGISPLFYLSVEYCFVFT